MYAATERRRDFFQRFTGRRFGWSALDDFN
jgi:hypothetical protein